MVPRAFRPFFHFAHRYFGDARGSIAVQFAFAMVPLAGLIGGAVDFAFATRTDAKLQAGLDAAVLAGARDGTDDWSIAANTVFSENVDTAFRLGASPTFTRDEDGDVTGSIAVTVPTHLIKIVGISSIPVTAHSVASADRLYDNSCILTLGTGHSVSSDSITFNGAPNIQLDQCTLRSNTSMRCNGHGGGSVASIAAGAVSGCSNPQPNSTVVPDIYAHLANNITPTCGGARPGATWTPGVVPVGVTSTDRGTYTEHHVCGNLTLSGSGFLTGNAPAKDTVIVIENGSLVLDDSASISTQRVTFVLTGNNSYPSAIDFPNGGHAATLNLSPSTSQGNPWRGVSVFQDPILTNVDNDWGSAVTLNPDGVVYLPNSNVTMSGHGASGVTGCTKFVSSTFRTNGGVNLAYKPSSPACASLAVNQWFEAAPYLSQ